jgi:hypothetical protein
LRAATVGLLTATPLAPQVAVSVLGAFAIRAASAAFCFAVSAVAVGVGVGVGVGWVSPPEEHDPRDNVVTTPMAMTLERIEE